MTFYRVRPSETPILPMMRLIKIVLAAVALTAATLGLAQDPPTVSVSLDNPKPAPGAVVKGKVLVTFAPGLHAYQNPPTMDYMIPLTVASATTGIKLTKVSYPKGEVKMVAGEDSAVYDGSVSIPFEFVAGTAPGKAAIKLKVGYQQCTDSNCFAPDEVMAEVPFEVVGTAAPTPEKTDPAKPPTGEVEPPKDPQEQPEQTGTTEPPGTQDEGEPRAEPAKDSGDTSAIGSSSDSSSAPPTSTEEGLAGSFTENIRSGNYIPAFGLLFLIGLLLNLTPCVYPLIPITLGFFSSQAAGSRAVRLQLGGMYMVGIALMYGAVGGISSAIGAGFGALFTQSWFNIALGVFMVVLALSMFGLYEIGIPAPLQKQLRGRSGSVGALIMGLLVGIGAAPCAGPAIVPVAVEAANAQSIPLGVAMFSTVGLGLGLPYLALAATTAGAKSLPRAGGWMTLVKAILGLAVIGFGLMYVLQGVQLDEEVKKLVWVAYFVASAGYLFLFDKSDATAFSVRLKGATILAFGVLAGITFTERGQLLREREFAALAAKTGGTVSNQIAWIKFDEETFEQAKASGKPIFIDATADWCAKCHEIEREVFNTPRGIVALNQVVAMKIDWSTGVDQAYKDKTAKMFDIVGLPHLVILKPGGERSDIKNGMHSVDELEAVLRKAGANL